MKCVLVSTFSLRLEEMAASATCVLLDNKPPTLKQLQTSTILLSDTSVSQKFRQGSAGWFFCSTRPRQGSLSRISPLPPSLSRSPPHSLLQLELLFSMPLTPRSTEVDTAGILGVVPRTHTPSMSMFYGSKLSGPRGNSRRKERDATS